MAEFDSHLPYRCSAGDSTVNKIYNPNKISVFLIYPFYVLQSLEIRSMPLNHQYVTLFYELKTQASYTWLSGKWTPPKKDKKAKQIKKKYARNWTISMEAEQEKWTSCNIQKENEHLQGSFYSVPSSRAPLFTQA